MLATFKRSFLLTMLALTGLAAIIMAVAVFRAGRQPEVMTWALKCAAAVGFLLIISFAGFTAVDRETWQIVAIAGMLCAAFMLLGVPFYAWWEIAYTSHPPPGGAPAALLSLHLRLGRTVNTGLVVTGVFCLVPFVMIPRMKRIGRIVQWTTVLYLSVASITSLVEIWELHDFNEPMPLQDVVFALLIPAGVCMMGVFVLHKFFEIPAPDPMRVLGQIGFVCPRCAHQQSLAEGDSRCEKCRLKIRILLEEPLCPNCRFNLRGLTRAICPECGHALDDTEVARDA